MQLDSISCSACLTMLFFKAADPGRILVRFWWDMLLSGFIAAVSNIFVLEDSTYQWMNQLTLHTGATGA